MEAKFTFVILILFAGSLSGAQTTIGTNVGQPDSKTAPRFLPVPSRISGPIDSQDLVPLTKNVATHMEQYDVGNADPNQRLHWVTLILARSQEQEVEFRKFLSEQQQLTSPNYHRRLTPEQYADKFGISEADVSQIVAWAKSQGLELVSVARGRDYVVVGGTVQQLQYVFQTEIHTFTIRGEMHIANVKPPSIPRAFASVITGISGLTDIRPKPVLRRESLRPVSSNWKPGSVGAHPDYQINSQNYLAPGDIWSIYSDNTGFLFGDQPKSTLVVAGESDIDVTNLQQFWSLFVNPQYEPSLPQQLLFGSDPGFNAAETEAEFDLEWASALAIPIGNQVIYAYAGGALDAATSAIDNSLGNVVSIPYGLCESEEQSADPAYIPYFQQEVQKANALGIVVVASTGDVGPASCDTPDTGSNPVVATHGLSVNFPASVPEVTAVGGTELDEALDNYCSEFLCWAPFTGASYFEGTSAEAYIPEMVWNDSSPGSGLPIAAPGSGASILFPKPAWQNGPGVPADGARDLPDVSVSASPNHDGYLLCAVGSCASGIPSIYGGTSASTIVFSAFLPVGFGPPGFGDALFIGNLNEFLYQMLNSPPIANVGGSTVSGTSSSPQTPLNDITVGNNYVSCSGTSDCPASGSFGFAAGPGYDQVTGVGSINLTPFYNSLFRQSQFVMGPSTGILTVSAGSSAAVTLNVLSIYNWSQSVSFACAGLPSGASCSFAPTTVTPPMGGQMSTTLTIATSGTSAAVRPLNSILSPVLAVSLCIPGFLSLGGIAWKRKTSARRFLGGALFAMILCSLMLTGCGGGSSNNGNGGNGGGGGGGGGSTTPSGQYTITVTGISAGASPITRVVDLSLTVQ